MSIYRIYRVLSWQRISYIAALLFVLIVLSGCSGKLPAGNRLKTVDAVNFRVGSVVLAYEIDKSAVPPLSFYDMTYIHKVGDSQSITIFGDGKSIPFTKRADDEIVFTTAASSITITLDNISLTNNLGTLSPARLKQDKAWAWSHSLDDNSYLEESVRAFESYGYRGLIYLIARDVWPNRDEDWTLDEPNLHQLLANGWSLGNHTWAHECNSDFDYVKSVNDGYVRLKEVVANSSWPTYKLSAFAAPCFDPTYHPTILEMRNAQVSDVLFNESGFEHLLRVDDIYTDTVHVEDRRISGFNFDLPIGRDVSFENNPSWVLETFDWMSLNAMTDQHFWYNTFSHGNKESTVRVVLDHIDKKYGRNGTDEVWIAPADEIYSYLLLREKMVISSGDNIVTTEAPRQAVVEEQTPVVVEQAVAVEAPVVTSVEQEVESIVVVPINGEIRIEVAHQSGVAGFPFSVFGSGFGQVQETGSVTINNVNATVVSWQDDLIEGIVPQTADGRTILAVTNSEGDQASDKFTVYSINPEFLQPITQTFRDVAHGKPVVTTEADDSLCFQQPGDIVSDPAQYLTNYRCGYEGYTRIGEAIFSADSRRRREAIIAVNTEEVLQGDYMFQFFSQANWYPYDENNISYPEAYVIEISADSTNGENGTWQSIHQQSDNNRATRLHAVTIPNGNNRWVRMRVTDGNGDNNEEVRGNDFYIREVRFYETSNADNSRPATYAVYGDSLTADAFDLIGPLGLSERLKTANNDDNDIVFSALGLSGQDSSALEPVDWHDYDIYDAFELDNMGQQIRFWGIGIGTNDAGAGSGQINVEYSNIALYDERLTQMTSDMIAQGNVPLIARIPDSSLAWGYKGDLGAKKKLLADIDAIAARHKLIPGPDFYTLFRKNLTYQNSTFIREGDGIHHTELGQLELVHGWADAFARIPFGGVAVTQPAIAQQQQPVVASATSQACSTQGLKMDIWDDITGDVVDDLTSHPTYTNPPTRVWTLEAFESISAGDEFGARISGYLTVPVMGDYTFWIAGDDRAELWLSSDTSRDNLVKIAHVPDWTWTKEWDKFGEQQSSELKLEAGQRYYIEVLWKDSSDGDHVSVAWETPISEQALISAEFLCMP